MLMRRPTGSDMLGCMSRVCFASASGQRLDSDACHVIENTDEFEELYASRDIIFWLGVHYHWPINGKTLPK